MAGGRKLVRFSDLRENRPRVLDIDGERIVLVRVEHHVYAISNTCPHNGGDLGMGDVRDGRILCPVHLAWYDLATGRSIVNANSVARTYPVEIDGDDVILLDATTGGRSR